MSKKSIKPVRDGGPGPKGRGAARFFDWRRSDPTKYAGVTDELVTYKENLKELLPRQGEFVLIKGRDVIGIYSTPNDALAVALDRFKDQRVLIKQIVARELIHSLEGVAR